MALRCMNEERMAEIDGPRLTYCQGHRPVDTHFAEVHLRHTRLAGRFEEAGHVHMRADPDPRWSIILANIRKKKQHQQGASARGHIYAPSGKIVLFFGIAVVTGKTAIDVPAGIAGIIRMRETHWKGPEAIARLPAPLANESIESVMEYRPVHRLLKGSPSIAGQPNDGFCPCCRIMWIEGDVPPHDGAALLGHLARKSVVDTDEPIPNELLYLPVAQRTRAQTIIVSHDVSLYPKRSPTTPKAEAAGLLRYTGKNSSAAVACLHRPLTDGDSVSGLEEDRAVENADYHGD